MAEKLQEKINIAVAIQALTSSVDFMKGQLTGISTRMEQLTTKAETDTVKKEFNDNIKEIKNAMLLHNDSDKESFGSLEKQNDDLRKIIYMWIGGLAVVTFLIPVLMRLFWK